MPSRKRKEYASTRAKPYNKRQCLKCNKMFASYGPGNRICSKCTQPRHRVKGTQQVLPGKGLPTDANY